MEFNLRAEALKNLEKIILGIGSTYNPNTLHFELPYRKSEKQYQKGDFEAFERSMVGMAIYFKATGTSIIGNIDYGALWKKGLLRRIEESISDPNILKTKSGIGSQIAVSILISRNLFWDTFSNYEKKKIALFLKSCSELETWPNNHLLFRMLPLPIIEEMNLESNREKQEKQLEEILSWCNEFGWFKDGYHDVYDWYTAFGFHLYLQILYTFDIKWREKYGRIIQIITKRYLKNFIMLFDEKGRHITFGRSLGYRYSTIAPIGWMIKNNLWNIDIGIAKSIISKTLNHYNNIHIFSRQNLIQPGFFGNQEKHMETYYGYGSQYFLCNAFSFLLLPKNHEFWSSKEAVPRYYEITLPHGAIIKKEKIRCTLFNIENNITIKDIQEHIKYFQHSYSSDMGLFVVGEGNDAYPNQTGVSIDAHNWVYRNNPKKIMISERHCISKWEFRIDDKKGFLITHHILFKESEIYVIYHTYPEELFINFSGVAYSKGENNFSEIKQLTNHDGNIIETYAGKSIYSNLEGVYPEWKSIKKIKPKNLIIFHSKYGSIVDKNKIESVKPKLERKDDKIILKFENREIIFTEKTDKCIQEELRKWSHFINYPNSENIRLQAEEILPELIKENSDIQKKYAQSLLNKDSIYCENKIEDYNFLQIAKNRKSIREFEDKMISEEDIKYIIKCAIEAPSACNLQKWKFIIVKIKKYKEIISRARKLNFLKDVPVLICVGIERIRYHEEINDEIVIAQTAAMDASSAIMNIIYAAQNLDISSCWINLVVLNDEEKQKLNKELDIDKNIELVSIVCLGYSKKEITKP